MGKLLVVVAVGGDAVWVCVVVVAVASVRGNQQISREAGLLVERERLGFVAGFSPLGRRVFRDASVSWLVRTGRRRGTDWL